MNSDPLDLLYVDESRIEEEHDSFLLQDGPLRRNFEMLCISLQFLIEVVNAAPHQSEDELVFQRLVIRCFNSGAAGLRLARMGYFNQCTALVRDIMETQLLLELFQRDRRTIQQWVRIGSKERNREFNALSVRKRLEVLDEQSGRKQLPRHIKYGRLCAFGTHPSPEGFMLMAIGDMTQVGPFPDQSKFEAMLAELAKHLAVAAIVLIDFTEDRNTEVLHLKKSYLDRSLLWWASMTYRKSGQF